MSLLIIEHPRGGSPGRLTEVAALLGREIERHSFVDSAPDPDKFSALVVMGGLENVDEQEQYPYLRREIAYMQSWLSSGKPLLGICLGAQLLSLALGGSATKMSSAEIGWHPFTHHARLDPLLDNGGSEVALQWHSYTTLPPPEAKILASNDYGIQAFRYQRAWGVQFHPEGNHETIERWIGELEERGDHDKVSELRQGIISHGPAWRRYGSELFGRFLVLSNS